MELAGRAPLGVGGTAAGRCVLGDRWSMCGQTTASPGWDNHWVSIGLCRVAGPAPGPRRAGPDSAADAQAFGQVVVQIGVLLNGTRRLFNVVLDPSEHHPRRARIGVEQAVGGAGVAVARLADRTDVDQRLLARLDEIGVPPQIARRGEREV